MTQTPREPDILLAPPTQLVLDCRDYEAIVQDFVTLDFIPPGTDLRPILPVLAKVTRAGSQTVPVLFCRAVFCCVELLCGLGTVCGR